VRSEPEQSFPSILLFLSIPISHCQFVRNIKVFISTFSLRISRKHTAMYMHICRSDLCRLGVNHNLHPTQLQTFERTISIYRHRRAVPCDKHATKTREKNEKLSEALHGSLDVQSSSPASTCFIKPQHQPTCHHTTLIENPSLPRFNGALRSFSHYYSRSRHWLPPLRSQLTCVGPVSAP